MELDSANSMHPLIDGKGEPASEEEEVDPIEDGTQVEGMVASQAEQRGVLQAVGGRRCFAGIGAAKIARGLEPAGEKKKHGEAWTKGMYTHALTKFARGIPAERAFKREGARQHTSPKTGSEHRNLGSRFNGASDTKQSAESKTALPVITSLSSTASLYRAMDPSRKRSAK